VGIITLNAHNYGNRLQNYATEQVLKSLGFEVETIVPVVPTYESKNMQAKFNAFRNMSSKKKYQEIKSRFYKLFNCKKSKIKSYKFKKFSEKYLNEKKYKINDELSKEFDFFIAGSDQIWNPKKLATPDEIWSPKKLATSDGKLFELLNINNKRKIAFAASFGITKIPEEKKEYFRKMISDFKYLSVREEVGANIIRDLTGRDAELLVDPTMLLNKDKWLEISKKPDNKPKEKYLLVYLLGNTTYEQKKKIDDIAKEKNLKIIKLADVKEKKYYESGPQEFINYFHSAELIITNSFHGTVFAILFEKPFVEYKKDIGGMCQFSRLETLLKKFKFENRYEKELGEKNIFDIDFTHVDAILEKERAKSINYLKKSLNVEDNYK